ncbi:hypothetical protein V1477_001883, partial [Vespula maculifrons]
SFNGVVQRLGIGNVQHVVDITSIPIKKPLKTRFRNINDDIKRDDVSEDPCQFKSVGLQV